MVPALPGAIAAESDYSAQAADLASRGEIAMAAAVLSRISNGPERTAAISRLAEKLAATDVEQAAAFASTFPPGLTRDAAAESVAVAWSRTDEKAALAYALALADPASRGTAIRTLTAELVRRNPRATLESILALAPHPGRDEAARRAAATWISRDEAGALDWLRSRPADEFKTGLTASMGFELAQKNPRAALALVESLPAGVERRAIWLAAAETWVTLDPIAAAEWAKQLPDPESRELALQGFTNAEGYDSVGTNRAPTVRRR